jgi:CarboxypepD_reg-like domain
MKRLYLLALFLFSIQLYSQELRVKITGKIKSDSTFVENVHIYNKTTNRGTISNAKGVFQIFVKSSDTLFFSNILFAKKSMIVNKKQIEKKFMAVSLNPSTNELEEIIIYNMAKSLGLPNADKEPLEPTERKINYYTKGGALNNIYGWLSGDKKKLKKLQTLKDADDEDFEKSLLIVDVRDQFQNEFFTKTLNITEENINDFISYCIDDNFIFLFSKERYIEIIDIFIKNRDAFLNSKQ